MTGPSPSRRPVLSVEDATLALGGRTLWHDLDLEVLPGEIVAVLGPNGSGKSSLLKVILGQLRLAEGRALLFGEPVRRGDSRIGYIPQQRIIPDGVPLLGRELVALGANGHRFGLPVTSRAERDRVDALIEAVGASGYARRAVGLLSGGEQQRLRAAQALAGEPLLLLADEPLLSLDTDAQRLISGLIDRERSDRGLAVVFVTHDLGPISSYVDRVLSFGEDAHRHHPHHAAHARAEATP